MNYLLLGFPLTVTGLVTTIDYCYNPTK